MQSSHVEASRAQSNAPTQTQATTWVYALTEQESNASNSVVSGTLFIGSHPNYVLFDAGATHSFIFTTFVRKLSIPCVYLRDVLCVDTPTSG